MVMTKGFCLKLASLLLILLLAIQSTEGHGSTLPHHIHKDVAFETAGFQEFVLNASRNASYSSGEAGLPPHCENTGILLMNATNLPQGTGYDDFRIVVLYNESAESLPSYTDYLNRSDARIYTSTDKGYATLPETLGNITYTAFIWFTFAFPYSLFLNDSIPSNNDVCLKPESELEKYHSPTLFNFEEDDPYRFKVVIYYLGKEPVNLHFMLGTGASPFDGGSASAVLSPSSPASSSETTSSVSSLPVSVIAIVFALFVVRKSRQ